MFTTRFTRITAILGVMLVVAAGSWWFFLRPPIGVRLALSARPNLQTAASRRHYIQQLDQNLQHAPHTTAALFEQADEWGVLAGLGQVKATAQATKPLSPSVVANLKKAHWPGSIPSTPEALSAALSTVANTAALADSAQWAQSSIPATAHPVTATAADQALWHQWRSIPRQPAAAIPVLQQFIQTTAHTWSHGPVSLASVELTLVASQQLEADDAALNGSVAAGLAQAMVWRQVGLGLPADWHHLGRTSGSSHGGTPVATSNFASPPFAAAPPATGEQTWTITAQPDTAMALTVVAVNQLSQALTTALSVTSTLRDLPNLLANVAQIPQEIGVLSSTAKTIVRDSQLTTTSQADVAGVAQDAWNSMQALQQLIGLKSQGQGLTTNVLTAAQAVLAGRSAFPLHAVWYSSRYGSLSGTPVVKETAHLTTDLATAFPHSTIWVEGSPYEAATVPLGQPQTHVTAVLDFPMDVFWASMELDASQFINPLVSDLLDLTSADTLGLSLLVSFAVTPLINHLVVDSLQQHLTQAQHKVRAVPVVGPNPWILPSTIDQALQPDGAWAGTVWTLPQQNSEAFVAYYDSTLHEENLAVVAADGQVLWTYWNGSALKHPTHPTFNATPIHVWWRPAEREAVVSITVAGLDVPQRQLLLFRWTPNSATPQVSELNGNATASTPALAAYTKATSNYVFGSFGNVVGLAKVQVGPNGTIYVESLNAMAGIPGSFTISPRTGTGWALSTNTLTSLSSPAASLPLPGSTGTLLPYRTARNHGSDEMLNSVSSAKHVTLWTASTLQGIGAGIGESPAPSALQAASAWLGDVLTKHDRQAWALMTPTLRQSPGFSPNGTGGVFLSVGGWGSLRGLEANGASETQGLSANGLQPASGHPNAFTETRRSQSNGLTQSTTVTIDCTSTANGWLVNNLTIVNYDQ